MLWTEFAGYQNRMRVPLETTLRRLVDLRTKIEVCLRELQRVMAEADKLAAELRRFGDGPYSAAIAVLKAEYVVVGESSLENARTMQSAFQYCFDNLRLWTDLLLSAHNEADKLPPEAERTIVDFVGLSAAVAPVIAAGPVTVALSLTVAGATALNSLMKLLHSSRESEQRLRQSRRDEDLRGLLECAVGVVTDLAVIIDELLHQLNDGCGPVVARAREHRARAEQVLRLATAGDENPV